MKQTKKQVNSTDNTTNTTRTNSTTRTRRAESQRIAQSGYTLTILDDYSAAATGKYITLDFSGTAAQVPSLAEEAIALIRKRYERGAASPSYFKVMVPAIEKFSEFAKLAGNRSFAEYSEELRQRFLEFLAEKGGSKKYTLFCWSIPGMIQRDLAEMTPG